ncbi:MAG TPA: phosphoribosylaminoimidazolesuccinocarboxamide synthase [Dehalococcoidia bacterium]|nr:phosphoribosylaminoimidazolesuccinocarboxamide synthase [Dehalococcoidia bacterium]
MVDVLMQAEIPGIQPLHRGKVRDTFDLGDRLLMVATDRVSAFDVIMAQGIPGKGELLSRLSAFWFEKVDSVVPTHLLRIATGAPDDELPFALPPALAGRSLIVRKAERINAECIVRGYLAGTAWAEYRRSGAVCGMRLPPDLEESQQLPEPIFTPSTKEEHGHDRNISYAEFVQLVGHDAANVIRLRSLATYRFAAEYARRRGLILADTKFEFGFIDGELCLIDEALTPDSSRFWPLDGYRPGRPQPSFDKQLLRDWLSASGWNKEPPPPALPAEIVQRTSAAYQQAYRRLTGTAPA